MEFEEFKERVRKLKIDENIKSKLLENIDIANMHFKRAEAKAREQSLSHVLSSVVTAAKVLEDNEFLINMLDIDVEDRVSYLIDSDHFQFENLGNIVYSWYGKSKEIVG